MDPFLKIVAKLDNASHPHVWEGGTDENLFSAAIDDLLAMPGSYEDNLKSLNNLIATHTTKQSGARGKEIDVPVFNVKTLDALIDDEMSGSERAEFRKKAGFDHEVRKKGPNRRNEVVKVKGFLNLDKPAPQDPDPDVPKDPKPPPPNLDQEEAIEDAKNRVNEKEDLTKERNKPKPPPKPQPQPQPQPKPVDIENPAQPAAQPEIDYDAALPGSKEAGNIFRGENYRAKSREATNSPMTEDAKFLSRAADTSETQEANRRLSRQSIRNSYSDEMQDWVDSNFTAKGDPRDALNELAANIKSNHGLDPEQWNDGVKNSFIRNYNTGNHIQKKNAFKDPMTSMTPHYDENGPTGNMTTEKQMLQDMQGQLIRFDESLPVAPLTPEQKMMNGIREDQKRFNGDLFGPEAQEAFRRETKGYTPEEYYDLNRNAQARATRDLNSNMAEAFLPQDLNKPTPGKAMQGPSRPLNEGFTAGGVIDKFKSSTANLMNQESDATNSVLDNVPMPQMPNTSISNVFKPLPPREVPSNKNINTLPFSLDKTASPPVRKSDQEYDNWQSRYGEEARKKKALMDQRMRDRQQIIKADRLASQAQSASSLGQGIF